MCIWGFCVDIRVCVVRCCLFLGQKERLKKTRWTKNKNSEKKSGVGFCLAPEFWWPGLSNREYLTTHFYDTSKAD